MSRLRAFGILFMEGGQQLSSRLAFSIEQTHFHFNTPPIKAQRKVIGLTSSCGNFAGQASGRFIWRECYTQHTLNFCYI
jgi:hypothetical protein